jgi:glycosyltransferase involved in cell wall biosynthesis
VKIALASKAFLPAVGGIETSSAMIARAWTAAGHDVEVLTAVPDAQPWREPYRVTRTWTPRALATAFARADLAAVNGYSRLGVVAAAATRRRLIVFHQGYQLICSDGLGFRDRTFHGFALGRDLALAFAAGRTQGAHALARIPFDAAVKVWPRGIRHVVPSRHVGVRLGLPRADVIYQPPSPTVIDAIAALGPPSPEERARAFRGGDVVFFGRLVFEKGCDDLVRAYALARRRRAGAGAGRAAPPRLIIYGRGPELPLLEALVAELGLGSDVDLRPFLGGAELARAARAASAVVIPSRWEEPGATIAVELYACGAAVIASATGAQGEIFAGGHGRLFPNGDVEGLAAALEQHLAEGARYPRPAGDEPWLLPEIERRLLRVIEPG